MAQTGFPSIPASAEVYAVPVEDSSTVVCVSRPMVDSWIIRNSGDVPVYIKYGDYCNPVVYTHLIRPHGIFADNYGGLITGCVNGQQAGLLLVTLKI